PARRDTDGGRGLLWCAGTCGRPAANATTRYRKIREKEPTLHEVRDEHPESAGRAGVLCLLHGDRAMTIQRNENGINALKRRVGELLPECQIRIEQSLIDAYAEISGDFNPIHVDVRAATASPFGGTIAHGCIPLEPVFHAVQQWLGGSVLPRDTTLKLRYLAPSRPGDVIRAAARLVGVKNRGGHPAAVIEFTCRNQHGERVIEGECECAYV